MQKISFEMCLEGGAEVSITRATQVQNLQMDVENAHI
jgi:hypothetical protein